MQVTFLASSGPSEVAQWKFWFIWGESDILLEREKSQERFTSQAGRVPTFCLWVIPSGMPIHKIAVQVLLTHRYSGSFVLEVKLNHLRVSTRSEC